ncbi:phosphatidylinositolglycan class, partial [Cooperia oncophora]
MYVPPELVDDDELTEYKERLDRVILLNIMVVATVLLIVLFCVMVLTPFIAWGAGVQKGGVTSTISQVDLTPLLASLIGVAVPVNSMGVLPTQILDVSPNYLFKSSFANFLQARLKEQFLVLREEKAKRLWFQDFDTFGLKALQALESEIMKLAKLRRFVAASSLFVENASYIKKAIFHYHRYDRAFLGAAISCCFMAWIALVWCYLTRDRSVPIFTRKTLVPNRIFSGLLVCLAVFCLYCRLPLMNWFYLLLPLFLVSVIENVLNVTLHVYSFIGYCITNYSTVSFTFMLQPFLGLIATSILLFIYVIIFIERRFLAALFVLLSFVPNLYSSKVAEEWKRIWQLMCVVLLPFPFLPNVGKSEIPLLCVGASLLLAIILRKLSRHPLLEKKTNDLYKLSVMLVTTALLIVVSSYLFQKPPALLRLISWLSLPFSMLLPLFSPSTIVDRSIWFICCLFVPYSLLSIAYESTFTLCFIPLLLMFLRFEFSHLSDAEFLQLPADQSVDAGCSSRSSRVTGAELRRAVICVSFVLATMFGTGNFASMNSFNPSTLSRFISVFSPFTMATLLVLKIFIPLLMISLLFAAVLRFNHEAIQRLSCLVLIITDLMAMVSFL